MDIHRVVPSRFDLPLAIDYAAASSLLRKNNPFSAEQRITKLEAEKNLYSTKPGNRFNGNISLNYGINQYADHFIEAY